MMDEQMHNREIMQKIPLMTAYQWPPAVSDSHSNGSFTSFKSAHPCVWSFSVPRGLDILLLKHNQAILDATHYFITLSISFD